VSCRVGSVLPEELWRDAPAPERVISARSAEACTHPGSWLQHRHAVADAARDGLHAALWNRDSELRVGARQETAVASGVQAGVGAFDSLSGPAFRFGLYVGRADHIAPADLSKALAEIHRCSNSWIWGFEYYAPQLAEIRYRDHRDLLWKADYAARYLGQFSDLELVRERHLPYLNDANVDSMFLLKRSVEA